MFLQKPAAGVKVGVVGVVQIIRAIQIGDNTQCKSSIYFLF
jgi:hypothetical protein